MPHVSSKALWVSLGVPLLLPGSGTILLVPASQSDRNQAHIVADFSVHFNRNIFACGLAGGSCRDES
jgi:hypothetical protein